MAHSDPSSSLFATHESYGLVKNPHLCSFSDRFLQNKYAALKVPYSPLHNSRHKFVYPSHCICIVYVCQVIFQSAMFPYSLRCNTSSSISACIYDPGMSTVAMSLPCIESIRQDNMSEAKATVGALASSLDV